VRVRYLPPFPPTTHTHHTHTPTGVLWTGDADVVPGSQEVLQFLRAKVNLSIVIVHYVIVVFKSVMMSSLCPRNRAQDLHENLLHENLLCIGDVAFPGLSNQNELN